MSKENNIKCSNTIADRVRHLLELNKEDMDQKSLAIETGIDPADLSNMLSYKKNKLFHLDDLVAIARAFNVSTDYLLGLEHNKDKPLSNFLRLIFEADRYIPVNIETVLDYPFAFIDGQYMYFDETVDEYEPTDEGSVTKTARLTISNTQVNDVLIDWQKLKELSGNKEAKAEAIAAWEKQIVFQASQSDI